MEFDILPGEAFYGGAVMDGINQPYTQASERELDLTRNQTPKPDDAVAALNGRALGVEPGWYAYIVSKGAHSVYRWDDFRTKYRRVASSISRCDGTLLSLTRDPAR